MDSTKERKLMKIKYLNLQTGRSERRHEQFGTLHAIRYNQEKIGNRSRGNIIVLFTLCEYLALLASGAW